LPDQFHQENLPADFENVFPDDDVIKAMLGKPFVEQLRLIALADTRIRYAVADFSRLRAAMAMASRRSPVNWRSGEL
jgi:hypothetical protein